MMMSVRYIDYANKCAGSAIDILCTWDILQFAMSIYEIESAADEMPEKEGRKPVKKEYPKPGEDPFSSCWMKEHLGEEWLEILMRDTKSE